MATPRSCRSCSVPVTCAPGQITPNTLPGSVNALARNSGWIQVIAMLRSCSTIRTTPMSPSGETTGSKAATPARLPAESTSVRPSVGTLWCSTSAAMYRPGSLALRPRRLRSRWFSSRSEGRNSAACVAESRSARSASKAARLVRDSSARCCIQRNGRSTVPRMVPVTAAPQSGRASITSERTMQARKRAVSRRESERSDPVAITGRGRFGTSRSRRGSGRRLARHR